MIFFIIINFIFNQQLILNGDFEDSLNYWQLLHGTGYYDTVKVAPFYHPDPDNEVYLYKYDADYIKLFQTVNIPHIYLRFSFSGKLLAKELNPSAPYWAFSSVILEYLDEEANYLGRTMFIYKTPHCSVANNERQHLIEITDTLWNDYQINLFEELANLPGINPFDVKKIRVALFDSTNGC
jgi:hypothetical protein